MMRLGCNVALDEHTDTQSSSQHMMQPGLTFQEQWECD